MMLQRCESDSILFHRNWRQSSRKSSRLCISTMLLGQDDKFVMLYCTIISLDRTSSFFWESPVAFSEPAEPSTIWNQNKRECQACIEWSSSQNLRELRYYSTSIFECRDWAGSDIESACQRDDIGRKKHIETSSERRIELNAVNWRHNYLPCTPRISYWSSKKVLYLNHLHKFAMPAFLTEREINLQAVWIALQRITKSLSRVLIMTNLVMVLLSVSFLIESGWCSIANVF